MPNETSDVRIRGYLKSAVVARGFGFIRTEEGHDYFVNLKNFEFGLPREKREELFKPGTYVEFTPVRVAAQDKCNRALRVKAVLL